ncbi:lysophosphatidic acid receptor 5b [Triplophysa rosa]|uniref:Lysophosphatidic acid receptor 5b n=1 Tax=Triplophysa rosa TaxID=992332 RepID=A0A9W7TPS7_TRIRA|nr:lysophosphatidic acid receptor 5b [Triplophysa rosa]KAI7801222.1 lysophosphatidic acid receptor 5b [Triplophysa rosa]
MSVNLTNSTCTDQLHWTNRYLVSAVVYGLVLAVGLPLNGVSLWILLRRHGLRSSSAVLMINLAVSDLLLALSLPLRIYFYATLRWPFGAGTCTAAVMLFRINFRTSCVFITLISLDRFFALVFPMRSRSLRTSAFASKCCALVWILLTLLCIPDIVNYQDALKTSTCGSNITCFESRVIVKGSHASALGQAIFLLILLVVNIVCTAMVICALRKRPSGDKTKVNNKMSVILIFAVNMVVFVVFFMPFALQLMMLDYNTENKKGGQEVLHALVCLASINCCLDPLIYYFSLDSFWQDKGKKVDATTHSLSRSMERS